MAEMKTLNGYEVVDEKAREYIDQLSANKSQIQMGESGSLTIIPVLKIHRMTRDEYDNELANGNIEPDALYVTPEEKYVTHSWDGTTLIITSASGTTSADLKGPKGDPGSDASVTATNIKDALGYTPANANDTPTKTETWTFTLADGSTVTKEVYVK